MKDKKTVKKILIALVVAILLLGIYSLFNKGKSSIGKDDALVSKNNTGLSGQIKEDDTTVVNAKIIKVLGSISDIHLDDDIFSNPVFRTLKDKGFRVPRPVRVGKRNPFLPLGYEKLLAQQEMLNGSESQGTQERSNLISQFNADIQNKNNQFFGTNA